ncbi:MAG: ribulokinase [Thermoguttaceae bacterium]
MTKKRKREYAIGVDYGTNSVRAILVDLADGSEVASSVYNYPSGDAGILLDPKNPLVARQNPQDYIEGFLTSVANTVYAARKEGADIDQIRGIGVDTTGSTPIPVDEQGIPLALNPKFEGQLAAYAWLWKDHSSHEEAAKITAVAAKNSEKYLNKCGGTYSSEWYWSKIWHCKKENPAVFKAAYAWVELADFVPAYVTGNTNPKTLSRGICATGHKAMYNEIWGGLPSKNFLKKLDPDLVPLRDRFAPTTKTSDQIAGYLVDEVALQIGTRAGIPVAVGAMDAHMGAVGAGIKPGTLVKIIGTSTCDMMVYPKDKPLADIPGLCGIVPGSVLPDMYGLEAGQSAVGDIFNWFARYLTPGSLYTAGEAHTLLTQEAAKLEPGESGLLALDWNNGNRTILVDPLLSGLLIGQTLHTTAPEIYRALMESTAFGALTIIKRFEEYGVEVEEVVNCGGIAEKNALLMQIYADVCNRPMKISRSSQTCALGAAIFGAVAGGAYKTVEEAQKKMTGVSEKVYKPNKKAVVVYEKLYALYRQLHDVFGNVNPKKQPNLGNVMKELIAIRESARK